MRHLRHLIIALAILALPAGAGGTESTTANAPVKDEWSKAIFAAGCFWCVEQAFDEVEGVKRTVSGYTGGHVPDPTYEQVSSGGTGHREAVLVYYDPDVASYEELLKNFWLNVDPTDDGGQFCDRGNSYLSAIYYFTEKQERLAKASKQELIEDANAPEPIVTPILEAEPFYKAEAYHQNYYEKNPVRYHFYKYLCGRQNRLDELWGDRAGGVG
ncbi:MAG: peptide-methionine (S)-S-oxide reductase MsrA [Nitrococcus sp.]|nr:peptide-methionine (S)-S-oxide reductase MsrA [Nitrococcus sp.]